MRLGLGRLYRDSLILPTQLVVNSGTTPKNGPQNLRYRCPTSDGPLKKNGTTSAGKPDNDAPTAGSQQPFNTSNSPNGISYAFIAWNTSISFQHAKPRANSSCICKPVLGRHVFILPFTPVTKYSSTGSTLVQIMAYITIAASFLYRLCRQEIGLRNRMLPVLMFLT